MKCKICNTRDVLSPFGQGICPTCGELFCRECSLQAIEFDLCKCPTCKIGLCQAPKKVYKDLVSLVDRLTLDKPKKSKRDKKYPTYTGELKRQQLISAQICLADRYVLGEGTIKNIPKAVQIYNQLVEMGSPIGHYNLFHYLEDKEIGLEHLRKSAEMGFYKAKHALSVILSDHGTQYDQESARLLKESALTGYTEAEYTLGLAYHQRALPGEDPKLAIARAKFWYKRAAEKKYPAAINNLGMLMKESTGITTGIHPAIELLEQAWQLGCVESYYGIGSIYEEKEDYENSKYYYGLSAAEGYPPSIFRLGLLIVTGKVYTCPQDLSKKHMFSATQDCHEEPEELRKKRIREGLDMIIDASERGHKEAKEYLGIIKDEISKIKT